MSSSGVPPVGGGSYSPQDANAAANQQAILQLQNFQDWANQLATGSSGGGSGKVGSAQPTKNHYGPFPGPSHQIHSGQTPQPCPSYQPHHIHANPSKHRYTINPSQAHLPHDSGPPAAGALQTLQNNGVITPGAAKGIKGCMDDLNDTDPHDKAGIKKAAEALAAAISAALTPGSSGSGRP